MALLTLGTLLGLLVASIVAWQLGGALGTGVMLGFVFAAAMTGLGVAWQRHVVRWRPALFMRASVGSFIAKLACLLMGGLAFRFLEPAAVRVDYRSYLVAFVATTVTLLLMSAPEVARGFQDSRRAAPRALGGESAP